VAYQNQIVMEETLDQALERLFGDGSMSPRPVVPTSLVADTLDTGDSINSLAVATPQGSSSSELADQAQDHYSRALEAQRQGNWSQYGEEIERLGEVLEELRESDSSQN
jgi:hypothetical protein